MPTHTKVIRGKQDKPSSNIRMMKNAAGEYTARPISGAGAGQDDTPMGKVIKRNKHQIPPDDKVALKRMTRYYPTAYGLLMKLYHRGASDRDYIMGAASRGIVVTDVKVKADYTGATQLEAQKATALHLDGSNSRVEEILVDGWMIIGYPRERLERGQHVYGWGIFGVVEEAKHGMKTSEVGKLHLLSQAYDVKSDADAEMKRKGEMNYWQTFGYGQIRVSELNGDWLKEFDVARKGSWDRQSMLFSPKVNEWMNRYRLDNYDISKKLQPMKANKDTKQYLKNYALETGTNVIDWALHENPDLMDGKISVKFKHWDSQPRQYLTLIDDIDAFKGTHPQDYADLMAAWGRWNPIYKPMCHYSNFNEVDTVDQFITCHPSDDPDGLERALFFKTTLMAAVEILGRNDCEIRFYPLNAVEGNFNLAVMNNYGETILIRAEDVSDNIAYGNEDNLLTFDTHQIKY